MSSNKKRSYTVKPTNTPGGYPGDPPVAPPPGGAGVGGYPGATLGQPMPQYPGGEYRQTSSDMGGNSWKRLKNLWSKLGPILRQTNKVWT